MKKYEGPEFHFIYNSGGLSGDDIAKLSEEEFVDYLKQDSISDEKKKYRISSDFILREIAGEYTIVPIGGENAFMNTMMVPNDSAVFLWKSFENPGTTEDAVRRGLQEYEVSEETIRNAANRFVKESLKYEILKEVKENESNVDRTES